MSESVRNVKLGKSVWVTDATGLKFQAYALPDDTVAPKQADKILVASKNPDIPISQADILAVQKFLAGDELCLAIASAVVMFQRIDGEWFKVGGE